MKYRYITAHCKPKDPINIFRMVSGKVLNTLDRYPGKIVYRIQIPKDLKLIKYSCDEYYTVDDEHETRLISDFKYDIFVINYKNKMKIVPKDEDSERISREELIRWRDYIAKGHVSSYNPFKSE